MRQGGCSVQVLVDTLGCASKTNLVNGGVTIKHRDALHSKTLITVGAAGHQNIYTGSHNTQPGALQNDELLVRVPVDGNPIYSGYIAYFNEGWNNSSTTVPCT
jgi:hypothetical protein